MKVGKFDPTTIQAKRMKNEDEELGKIDVFMIFGEFFGKNRKNG